MKDHITIGQMLKIMHSGEQFSVTLIKYDGNRRTGGQVRHYAEARILKGDEEKAKAQRPKTAEELSRESEIERVEKKPSHYLWFTRNIRLMQDGADTALIRKIHPPLVIEFNGKMVVA